MIDKNKIKVDLLLDLLNFRKNINEGIAKTKLFGSSILLKPDFPVLALPPRPPPSAASIFSLRR